MSRTTFMDVICNHAMVEISDIRLQNDMNISMARFMRKMTLYMQNAIPLFNRPPEAREWLKHTAPIYSDYEYSVPDDYVSGDIAIETENSGFEIVTAIKITPNGTGVYEYIPIPNMTYDAETGDVTIPNGAVQADDHISIDFYTDGYFDRNLALEIKNILGKLIQYVWETRFVNDWLIQQPKIKDKSFDVGNEANYMRASTERMRFLREQCNQMLIKFEQDIAYTSTVINNSTRMEAPGDGNQ